MTPDERAAIETAKARILAHLGTENPGRTASHFEAACAFPYRFVHGSHGLPYSRVIDRAIQHLRKAGLIKLVARQWWLTSTLNLTVEGVEAEVRDIEALGESDPEAAHGNERALWKTVLGAIRDGVPNAQGLAGAALKSADLKFPRW